MSNYIAVVEACKASGKLWEDPDFPANDSSIYYNYKKRSGFQWLRPGEICRGLPEFIKDGANQFDVNQGELGDCWMLAAAANISRFPKLFQRVIPPDQSFNAPYTGVFRFNFWRYGEWVEVLVDDQLPTRNGQLVYVHPRTTNEFWAALLEKAFAKIYGSYEAIEGGSNCDSLTDFTGGLVEQYFMDRPPKDLERLLTHASNRKSVMSASIYGNANTNPRRKNGLIEGHAYSVTGFEKVNLKDGGYQFLIRIRNPWGTEEEWKGDWCDDSDDWKKISAEQRKAMGNPEIDKDDGEFWMSLEDFENNFDSIEICNLTPDALESDTGKSWAVSMAHSKWVKDVSSGGRYRNDDFWKNPQFHLDVQDYDEDNDNKASCIVQVLQKNRRKNHLPYLTLGFVLYQVSSSTKLPLSKSSLRKLSPVDLVSQYRPQPPPTRMVVERVNLKPGRYVIVPTTWDEDINAEFMLRVFSESAHAS